MPEQIRCPECNATLRVPDSLLGKAVKCPKCQTMFTAEMEEPEGRERIVREPARSEARRQRPALRQEEDEEEELPPEEEEEDEDRPRRRRRRRRSSGAAASAVAGPAIALMVVSGLSIACGIVDLIFRIVGVSLISSSSSPPGVSSSYAAGQKAGMIMGGGFDILSMALPIIMLIGAIKMKGLRSYGLALTSCILGMLPIHCCCLLGLPFGIWGLVVLNKPEVKDAFS
jgi:predicted Zn finger-like uncharacterized protein